MAFWICDAPRRQQGWWELRALSRTVCMQGWPTRVALQPMSSSIRCWNIISMLLDQNMDRPLTWSCSLPSHQRLLRWPLDRSLLCCSGDVGGLGQRSEGTGECGIDASRGLLMVCRGRARCVPMAEECPCPVVLRTAVYEGVVLKESWHKRRPPTFLKVCVFESPQKGGGMGERALWSLLIATRTGPGPAGSQHPGAPSSTWESGTQTLGRWQGAASLTPMGCLGCRCRNGSLASCATTLIQNCPFRMRNSLLGLLSWEDVNCS